MDRKEINRIYDSYINNTKTAPKIDIKLVEGVNYYIEDGIIVSGPYAKASKFSDGFAAVKEIGGDKYHYINTRFQLSQDEYTFAKPYSCGYAAVARNVLNNEQAWQYRDINGNLSEHFYATNNYSFGYAAVKKDKFSLWQYRNTDGRLTEMSFIKANDYADGFGLVTMQSGEQRYRDIDGKLSEGYYAATDYKNGFGQVYYTASLNGKYRDILGNISNNITDLGKAAYLYSNDKISLEDIPQDMFMNERFVKFMKRHENENAIKSMMDTKNLFSAKNTLASKLDYIDNQVATASDVAQSNTMGELWM